MPQRALQRAGVGCASSEDATQQRHRLLVARPRQRLSDRVVGATALVAQKPLQQLPVPKRD
ncbi:MAG: hypothetical protein NZ693_04445 [Thermoflexales bacterium]|nr:hypothetical protein [Thermoflexales bacterium]